MCFSNRKKDAFSLQAAGRGELASLVRTPHLSQVCPVRKQRWLTSLPLQQPLWCWTLEKGTPIVRLSQSETLCLSPSLISSWSMAHLGLQYLSVDLKSALEGLVASCTCCGLVASLGVFQEYADPHQYNRNSLFYFKGPVLCLSQPFIYLPSLHPS